MNTSTARQECATLIIFVHYVQNYRQTPHPCCRLLTPKFHDFKTRSTWTGMIRMSIISNTWYFSQQTLLEALIVTGGSASCFSEQYRDLLLYLHQKLDGNNSNQQVHTAVQQYISVQYTKVCSHGIKFCTFCRIWCDTASAVRQQGEELLGETYARRNRQ